MPNGDHGRSRIINPNVMGRQAGLGTVPGRTAPLMMEIAIPADQEEHIRKTLQELTALARELNTQINIATKKLETLEKKRDALHLKEST